jgi:hypothetical protein
MSRARRPKAWRSFKHVFHVERGSAKKKFRRRPSDDRSRICERLSFSRFPNSFVTRAAAHQRFDSNASTRTIGSFTTTYDIPGELAAASSFRSLALLCWLAILDSLPQMRFAEIPRAGNRL